MDETSPVYENFLNQMRRFRRPVRENTRRISASKFLNKPESANIEEIKKLTGSILETLKRQEKFEYEQFLDLQRRYENDKRRNREKRLEGVGGSVKSILKGTAKKIAAPLLGFLTRILGFILTIFLGRPLIKLLNFLANPKNRAIVEKIGDFFATKFGFITAGIVAFGIAATGLMSTLVGLTGRLLLGSVLGGGGGGLGFLGNLKKLLPKRFFQAAPSTKGLYDPLGTKIPKQVDLTSFFKNLRRLNKGGNVEVNEPVIVGDNPDGSINKTTELFVPSKAGTIIPNSGIRGFLNRRLNRGSLNPFGQTKISSGAAGRVRVPVFSGRPNQNTTMSSRGTRFATRDISTARSYTNPNFKGLPGTGRVVNPKGTLDTGTLPKRYIQKFGSRSSMLGQDQIKMSSSAYARTFGRSMNPSTRSMLGLGKGLFKKLPLIDLLMDLAFPQPLADGTLTGAQQRNIPGTPIMRSNNTPPPPNLSEAFQQLSQNNSETFINDHFSVNLLSADEDVLATYGIGR